MLNVYSKHPISIAFIITNIQEIYVCNKCVKKKTTESLSKAHNKITGRQSRGVSAAGLSRPLWATLGKAPCWTQHLLLSGAQTR